MDKFDFDDLFNDWNVLFNRWKNKDEIKRYEIEELLEKGQIPTQKTIPLLLAIFKGEVIFAKPLKKENRPENWIAGRDAVIHFLMREKELKEQPKGISLKGDLTPKEQAKKEVAKIHNIDARQLRAYIEKYEKNIKKHIENIN